MTHAPASASGLPSVGSLPWGSHFCQFYNSREDLVETLVPYFTAGLKSNESCLWITSEPLGAAEAREAMIRAVPDFASFMARGQIEIRDLTEWYTPGARFDADDVLAAWIDRESKARKAGYSGLRLTGNTFWLERAGWDDFMAYEHKVNSSFGRYRVLALCTYCLGRCTAQDVIDVVRNHEFALTRRGGDWEMIESASLKVAKESLARLNVELEDRIRERTADLEVALRSRDDFLAMLAHELRNPLAPIRSAAGVVRMLAGPEATLRRAGEVLERQTAHLSRLVDDLLDTARITRGAIHLKTEVVDVASLLADSIEEARPDTVARRQSLTLRLPPDPLPVVADATRLTQVFCNLLDNASKYSPEGASIDVAATVEDGQVAVRVRDTGIGIPASMLRRVFDPFTQVNPTPDRPSGGLGLGLCLVKRLVEMQAGQVEAASEGEGRGSEFCVRMPLAAGAPVEDPVSPDVRPQQRQRILVVDDNPDARDALAAMLELLGNEVRTASHGDAALEEASRFLPQVVLLDIGLPRMDGYEVARRLRELEAAPGRMRIVALTGYGHAEDRRRAAEAGFDGFAVKPIAPDALTSLLAAPSLH